MKELRVNIQYLRGDGMAEGVDDLIRDVRSRALDVGFEAVEVNVQRLDSWEETPLPWEDPWGKIEWDRIKSKPMTMQCFGCEKEVGTVHQTDCPVAGR